MSDTSVFDEFPEMSEEEMGAVLSGLDASERIAALEVGRGLVDVGDRRDRLAYMDAVLEAHEGHGDNAKFLDFINPDREGRIT